MIVLFALVVAQTTAPSPIPWGDVVKFGVTPVLVLILVITGVLRVGTFVDKEQARVEELWKARLEAEKSRADHADAQVVEERVRGDRFMQTYQDKFLPAIEQSRNAIDRAIDFLTRTS